MHLIQVDTVKEKNELRGTRTWLVIADSLFEALSLIPAGYRPKAVEVQAGAVSGPGRVIGWLGPASVIAARPLSEPGRRPVARFAEAHNSARWPFPVLTRGFRCH